MAGEDFEGIEYWEGTGPLDGTGSEIGPTAGASVPAIAIAEGSSQGDDYLSGLLLLSQYQG